MGAAKKGYWSRLSGSEGSGKASWVALGLVFSVSFLFCFWAWQIWQFPKTISKAPKADYAIVLGATSHGPRPSPVFLERIEEGLRLYREGRVKKILFTGRPGDPPQARVARQYALAQGIPEADLLLETQSENTLENLRLAKDLVPGNPPPTFLIVTDPLHLRRAMLMSSDLQMKAFPAPSRSTRYQGYFTRIKFLSRETLAYGNYQLHRWMAQNLM